MEGSRVLQQCTFKQGTPVVRSVRHTRSAHAARIACSAQQGPQQVTRRDALRAAAAVAAAPLLLRSPAAFAAKVPGGFVAVKDAQDAYSFIYPFGWQEVGIDGQDIVLKDVIEPLESVSVSMVPTDKTDVTQFGDSNEVAYTLADKVLTSPTQQVTLVGSKERMVDGRAYIDFEFLVKNPGYTRHAVASVTVANGKFYTLVTGSNEKRWGRMKDKIGTVVRSFEVANRYE